MKTSDSIKIQMIKMKRFHKDARLTENFTETGLYSLTGQSKHEWLRYIIKELIDNSLEATDTPIIVVELNDDVL